MSRRVLLLAALLLVPAAPASAHSERHAARAFAAALIHTRTAMLAARPQFQAAHDSVNAPLCTQAVNGAPDSVKAGGQFALIVAEVRAESVVASGAYAGLGTALSRVRTHDRRLRSGRAALRRELTVLATVTPPPADLCSQFDSWRRAGYPDAGIPDTIDAGTERFSRLPDSLDRRIARAVRRLRHLGVPTREARLLSPEHMTAGLPTVTG